MAFRAPEHLIIGESDHWIVNHRVDSALPGYLMVAAKMETSLLSDLPQAALLELGPLLASVQRGLAEAVAPDHLYVGRYGHMSGFSIHFHVIPIYGWVKQAFRADSRYRVLASFYTPGTVGSDFDGSELTLYVWREFCESKSPPPVHGPSVAEVVQLLKDRNLLPTEA